MQSYKIYNDDVIKIRMSLHSPSLNIDLISFVCLASFCIVPLNSAVYYYMLQLSYMLQVRKIVLLLHI